jgi:hypothetical protein
MPFPNFDVGTPLAGHEPALGRFPLFPVIGISYFCLYLPLTLYLILAALSKNQRDPSLAGVTAVLPGNHS